jgi:hypothetical protein
MTTTWTRLMTWFQRPDSPAPLAAFRVMVATFCLVRLYIIRDSFVDLYGQYGLVQWAITKANLYPGLPHVGDVTRLLGHLGLDTTQAIYAILSAYLMALGALLVGWRPRLMAALAWTINFLWMHSGGGLIYGMDFFAHIALFYCIIMPTGDAYSVGTPGRGTPSVAAGVTRRMLQLQLCLVYLSSGLEKAAGIQWWNGEAIWRSLMLPTFQQYDMTWMASVPLVAMVAGWATVVLESGYAIAVWHPRTRALWVAGIVGLHLGIGTFLGMWLFGAIMIILSLGAFGAEVIADLRRFVLRPRWKEAGGSVPALDSLHPHERPDACLPGGPPRPLPGRA